MQNIDQMPQQQLDEALCDAVSQEDLEEVRRLLEAGADPNWLQPDSDSWGTMMCAVVGPYEILSLLVEHGGSSDRSLVEGEGSPLHEAAERVEVSALELLLKKGFQRSLHAFDYISCTPLIAAAKGEYLDAVKLLLEAGADVNAHDEANIGETALGAVADDCKLKLAKVLLDAGANPLIRGWMWRTAYERVLERKDPEGRKICKIMAPVAENFRPKTVDNLEELDVVRLEIEQTDPVLPKGTYGRFYRRLPEGLYHLHFHYQGEWVPLDLTAEAFRPILLEEWIEDWRRL